MDTPMAWMGYNQAYNPHLRGAMAANGTGAHQHPQNVHHPHHHPPHLPHPSMAAHYRQNSHASSSSGPAIPGHQLNSGGAPSSHTMSAHGTQFGQHQESMFQTCAPEAYDDPVFVSARQGPTSHHTHPHYSGSASQKSAAQHSAATAAAMASQSHLASKQHLPQFSHFASAAHYGSSSNLHSKQSNSSSKSSAKHTTTTPSSFPSPNTSDVSVAAAAAAAAAFAAGANFDSSSYYRCAAASNTTTTPTTDPYQSGSNPWSIFNSTTSEKHSHQQHLSSSSTSSAATSTQHHLSQSHAQSQSKQSPNVGHTSASTAFDSFRISSNVVAAAAVAAAAAQSGLEQQCHLNSFMNQNPWAPPQSQQASTTNHHHSQHPQIAAPSKQSCYDHVNPTSMRSKAMSTSNTSNQSQQIKSASDIPSARYSTADYNGIFHSAAAAAWSQNYSAMAKASAYQQQCGDMTMLNGFPKTPSATPQMTSQHAANSSKTASCTPSPHGQQPPPGSTNLYANNYGQCSGQSSHFPSTNSSGASPYFPMMSNAFSAAGAGSADPYFAAMAMEHRKRQQQQQQFQQQQQQQHQQQQQQQHQHSQHSLHSQHHSYPQHHQQQQQHSSKYSSMNSMIGENQTQQLMNYSNSFFEHASNNQQQPQQQSQPEAVVTSTSNTKKKRAPRKSRAVAASAATPTAPTTNQSTPIMMPEFNAYSNGYGAACSGGGAVMQQQQPQQSKRSVSRCSSVSSQHHQPQQQQQSLNRSTESVASHYTNNYSPATASGHSPYHSGASSQTCLGGSTASSGNDVGYYSSGTVFPSQTPTPTPGGYPTPPSSVGQNSNPRCNSNGELSPYSSNSMSSNMSQSYTNPGSSKTANSQISPVHNHEPIEPIIGPSGQFVSSCMMQKTQIVEDFYQSQPNNTGFATSQGTSYPVSGECDSVTTVQQNSSNTNNELYLEYGNSETVVQGASTNVNTNGYGQHQFDGHYESEEYSHVAEPSTELPSCSKARGQVVSGPIDTVMAVADTKDFHPHQHQHHHQSEHHPESFNLNFDSVIQPIEPQHHPQQELADPLIQTSSECETSSILLPSIDEFIVNDDQKPHPRPSSSAEIVSQDYHHHLLQNDSSQSQNCLQATNTGTTPTVSGNIIDDDEPMVECSQIHSIINSLPQSADEVEETEAVAAVVSAQQSFTSSEADKIEASIPAIIETTPSVDVYLSDLAPLFADSSKIALMESTFTDVVVAHNDVVTTISDADVDIKLEEEEDHGIDDDNSQRLKDFDEFLISEGVHTEPEVTAPEPENLEENLQTTTVLADATESAPEPSVECSEQESLRKKLKIEDESKKVEPQIQKEKKIKRKANDCTDSGSQTESKILDTPVQQLCQSKPEEPSSAKKRKIAVVHPKSKEVKKEVEMIVEPIKKPTKKESKSNKVNKETKESTKKSPKTKTNNKNRLAEISSNNKTLAAKLMLEDPVAKPKKVKPAKPIEAKQAASTSPNSRMEAKENDSSKKVASTKKSPASKAKIIPKIEISPVQTIPLMVKPPMLSTPFDLNHLQPQVQPKIVKSLPKPKQISPKPKKMPMKEVAISPKPAAGALKSTPISIQSSQNSGLLSPIAPGLSVPNKAKTPPTSFATPNVTNAPTLIMNQNGAQPYQMSPMTNAVLISIHPTLHPTNSSLAPSSTFILNPQNVSNSNGTSGTTNGALTTQTSVSRRKSQDKKLTTIREGLMRTGDFVVAEDEAQLGNPVIWRIEGKSLLQRFESTDQNGQTVYVNTSSYSAWNPTVREKYLGLDVRILGCNRSRTVVEKIGLTSSKKNELMNISIPEKEAVGVNGKTLEKSGASDKIASGNLVGYLEKFEVYMQTLVSQALDPSFIAEIVKDNDEYFLSHIKSIDDLCVERKTRFLTKQKWDLNLVKSIDAFPKTQIHQQSDVGDLRCRLCHDNWSTKILQFEGDVYDYKTLELQEPNADQKQTKLALCDSCTDKAFLYSKIHHQKYNFYIDCKTKVQNILTQDENKDSRDILEECLVDADWIKQLFAKFETMIATCERYST